MTAPAANCPQGMLTSLAIWNMPTITVFLASGAGMRMLARKNSPQPAIKPSRKRSPAWAGPGAGRCEGRTGSAHSRRSSPPLPGRWGWCRNSLSASRWQRRAAGHVGDDQSPVVAIQADGAQDLGDGHQGQDAGEGLDGQKEDQARLASLEAEAREGKGARGAQTEQAATEVKVATNRLFLIQVRKGVSVSRTRSSPRSTLWGQTSRPG